ncbi:MAG: hypothetical protein R6W90_18100 [Ignavibacteriaceae bacterium]
MISRKIFIWETQSIIALDLKGLLTKKGFEARIMASKEEIMPIISNETPELFIVCTDSDFELAAKLTNIIQCMNIPVIILSTLSKTSLIGQYDFSVVKYIAKPFDEEELLICIGEILDIKYKLKHSEEYFGDFQHSKKIADNSFENLILN